MSRAVTAVPVTVTSDRHARRDAPRRDDHAEEEEATAEPADHPASPVARMPEPTARPHAGTLFRATLLGQRMRTVAGDLAAMRAARSPAWTPPPSELRLKDKTV